MQTSIIRLIKKGYAGRFYELMPEKIVAYRGDWALMQPLMKHMCSVDK